MRLIALPLLTLVRLAYPSIWWAVALWSTVNCQLVVPCWRFSSTIGLAGGTAGVTAADAVELVPVAIALIAATRNVYAVPFVRPVTVKPVAAEPVFTAVWAVAPMNGVIR